MSQWNDFSEEAAKFPRVGDHDVFMLKNAPMPDKGYPGKYLVKTASRTISVYLSQITPIGAYFKANPKVTTCNVDWIGEPYKRADGKEGTKVTPVINTKLA